MTELPDLKHLTPEAKDALIESLWEEIQKLRRAAEKRPKKTSKNSSLPPSQGFKPSVEPPPQSAESSVKRVGSLGREGGVGKRQGLSAFQAIAAALNPAKSLFSLS
jgi:transposase